MRETLTSTVFVVALVARGVVFGLGPMQDPARAITEDSGLYLALARSLVEARQFAVAPAERTAMDQLIARVEEERGAPAAGPGTLVPETFRTPGYPAFVAVTSLGLWDLRIAVMIQCVLGAIAATLVMLLARRLGASDRGAAAAGLVWALHPALVVFDNLLLTESLFNVLVVSALWLAAPAASTRQLLAVGALLGYATLVRPPLGLLFVPAMGALAWSSSPRWWPLGVAAAVALVVPGAWMLRNAAIGEGLRLSTVADYSLIFYTAPCAVSEARGEDCDKAYPARHREIAARLERELLPGDEVVAVARRGALADIAANGTAAIRMYVKSVAKLAVGHSMATFAGAIGVPYQPSGLFSRLVLREQAGPGQTGVMSTVLALMWTALNAAVVAAAAAGLALAAWHRRMDLMVAFGLTAAVLVAGAGAVGQERIRLPMMLSLLMLGATTTSAHTRRLA